MTSTRLKSGAALAAAAVAGWAGPSLVWWDPLRLRFAPRLAGIGEPGHLALTFDDGPDPESTPAFLRELDRLGWKATFFMLGSMVAAAPALAAEVASAGHEVAVHGYRHRGSLRRSPGWIRDDLRRAISTIEDASGAVTTWYRPPFGELSTGALLAARSCRLRPVLWTAWGRDWRPDATPESVIADLRRGRLNGGTALLHDSDCTSANGSWKTALASLPLLADTACSLGLDVGPLRDHGLTGPPGS